jgi:hypothetical protein
VGIDERGDAVMDADVVAGKVGPEPLDLGA